MALDLILLSLLVSGALWTVLSRDLLRAAIGLGATSLVLSVLLFRLDSPLAAVFELSVCAGLITVVFAAAISLTRSMSPAEVVASARKRLGRYALLPVLLVVAAGVVFAADLPDRFVAVAPAPADVGTGALLWGERATDILGQILVLLTGVFGIVVLFKQPGKA